MALSRSHAGAAVVLIVALALGAGSGVVLAPEANAVASISTLTIVDGAVLLSHAGAEFTSAREGDVLITGDRIRTGAGVAEITYFEGSSVRVESNAEIVVAGRPTFDHGPVQALERVWRVITKLVSGGSRYEVRTPSATASVRG